MDDLHTKYHGKTVQVVGLGKLSVKDDGVFINYDERGFGEGDVIGVSLKLTPRQVASLSPHNDAEVADFRLAGALQVHLDS